MTTNLESFNISTLQSFLQLMISLEREGNIDISSLKQEISTTILIAIGNQHNAKERDGECPICHSKTYKCFMVNVPGCKKSIVSGGYKSQLLCSTCGYEEYRSSECK